MSKIDHHRFRDKAPKVIDEIDGMLLKTEVQALNSWIKIHGREPNLEPNVREHQVEIENSFSAWELVREVQDITPEDLEEIEMAHFLKRFFKWNADIGSNRGREKYLANVEAKNRIDSFNGSVGLDKQYLSQGRKYTLLRKYQKATGKRLEALGDLRWTNYRPWNKMSLADIVAHGGHDQKMVADAKALIEFIESGVKPKIPETQTPPFKVGDVLYGAGYFKVMGFTPSGKSVVLQQVDSDDLTVGPVYSGGYRAYIPRPDCPIGEPITRRLILHDWKSHDGSQSWTISIPDRYYGLSSIWDGNNPITEYAGD